MISWPCLAWFQMSVGGEEMFGNRWVYGVDFAPLFPRMLLCRLRRLPQWRKAWLYLTVFIYSREKAISLGNHFGWEDSVWDGCYDKLNVWAGGSQQQLLAAFGSWGTSKWRGERETARRTFFCTNSPSCWMSCFLKRRADHWMWVHAPQKQPSLLG